MIYGDGFNIIHMPKTGGTWLRRVCERLPRGCSAIRRVHPGHLYAEGLTEEEAALPTYVIVRNPWDWYVSLYGHWHGNVKGRRHEFRKSLNTLSPHWQAVARRFGGSFEQAMQPYARGAVRDPHTGHFSNSMSDTFSKFTRREGLDLRIRKFETGLPHIFEGILREHCPEQLTEDVLRLLHSHQRENASQRAQDYVTYYKPALRDLVQRLDGELIAEHGYQFGA